jgi:hypothetical protein
MATAGMRIAGHKAANLNFLAALLLATVVGVGCGQRKAERSHQVTYRVTASPATKESASRREVWQKLTAKPGGK